MKKIITTSVFAYCSLALLAQNKPAQNANDKQNAGGGWGNAGQQQSSSQGNGNSNNTGRSNNNQSGNSGNKPQQNSNDKQNAGGGWGNNSGTNGINNPSNNNGENNNPNGQRNVNDPYRTNDGWGSNNNSNSSSNNAGNSNKHQQNVNDKQNAGGGWGSGNNNASGNQQGNNNSSSNNNGWGNSNNNNSGNGGKPQQNANDKQNAGGGWGNSSSNSNSNQGNNNNGWGNGNSSANGNSNSSNQSGSVPTNVDITVSIANLPRLHNNNMQRHWAEAATMVVIAKTGRNYSSEEDYLVSLRNGMILHMYQRDEAIAPGVVQAFASACGLQYQGFGGRGSIETIADINRLLQRTNHPVMYLTCPTGDNNRSVAAIIYGISGDGTPDGTRIKLLFGGERREVAYSAFESALYEPYQSSRVVLLY